MLKTLMPQVNKYMFDKKESIVVKPENLRYADFASQYDQVRTIAGMLCNLHDLGYTIPRDELPRLYNMSAEELNDIVYQPLLNAAKEAKGDHVEHRVLFPGFPDSVRNIDIQTLSDIRFMSYFTTFLDEISDIDPLADGSITTEYVKDAVKNALNDTARQYGTTSYSWALNHLDQDKFYHSASEILDKVIKDNHIGETRRQPRAIHLVDSQAYYDMVKNMLSARASLSPYDQEIVKFTIDNFDTKYYMPDKIQFKENQAIVDKYNFEKGYLYNLNIKSIHDFERLLVALSDGDTSLSSKQMIRNFTNQERKRLATIFQSALQQNRPIMVESSANRQSLRFMDNVLKNRLHLNERLGDTYTNFVKQVKTHESVMAAYERNMRDHKYDVAAKILGNYSSTLLIQHTREIMGKYNAYAEQQRSNAKMTQQEKARHKRKYNTIINLVKEHSKCVDIKTLLSLEKELLKEHHPYKIMMPKSPSAQIVVKQNNSAVINNRTTATIIDAIEQGIKYQIQNHTMAGSVKIQPGTKIYIDPNLADCPIPTVGRNDTGKNRTVAPGTKLPVEKGDILRAALYKQNDYNQFIDFSAAFFDSNYKLVGQVSWNNLKQTAGNKLIAYHSGDTAACSGKGCTEIIDIDLKAAKLAYPEARHVAYMAIMWEGNPLSSCNQLFMTLSPTDEIGKVNGQKIPDKDQSGYSYSQKGGQDCIFNPADVQFKVDITGDATASIPMFYDMETGKAMVVNMETKQKSFEAVTNNAKHFELPQGCECLESYSSDLSLKCFAYDQMEVATIGDLARVYAEYSGATRVHVPELADVIFAVDRYQIDDMRHRAEGEELQEQVVITPYDKDVITAELIIDPKTIVTPEQSKEINHDLHNNELNHVLPDLGDRN